MADDDETRPSITEQQANRFLFYAWILLAGCILAAPVIAYLALMVRLFVWIAGL